jgi:hypothetical protein
LQLVAAAGVDVRQARGETARRAPFLIGQALQKPNAA